MHVEVKKEPPTSSSHARYSVPDRAEVPVIRKATPSYFQQTTEAAPLAVFRILFGGVMLVSILRFWSYGWIDKLYIQPRFFFSYYGLRVGKPPGPVYVRALHRLCAGLDHGGCRILLSGRHDHLFPQLHLHRADGQNDVSQSLLLYQPP